MNKSAIVNKIIETNKILTNNHLKEEIMLPLMNQAAFLPPQMLKSLFTFYFCMLLHLQNECRLKKSSVKQKMQMVTWTTSNLNTFMTENTTQTRLKMIKAHQKARQSAKVLSFQLTLHQNLHCYSPSSEKSIHHFRPTRNLPDRFFTIQKSIAAANTTAARTLKVFVKKGRIRQINTTPILMRM